MKRGRKAERETEVRTCRTSPWLGVDLVIKCFDCANMGRALNTCPPERSIWRHYEGKTCMTYQAPNQAGRGIGRCWGWPPPHGAWGCPPLWASGKWCVCQRWDSTAGPLGGPSSPSGSWSIPWRGRDQRTTVRAKVYNWGRCCIAIKLNSTPILIHGQFT